MDKTSAEKVCHIREQLAGRIGKSRFQTWFDGATQFFLDGERLEVTVPNPLVGTWITSNFMPQMIAATREVLGSEPCINVQVAPGYPHSAASPAAVAEPGPVRVHAAPQRAPLARARTAPPQLRGELEKFVVGPSNQLAYSAALTVVQRPRADCRLLVVHGGCGLGKTHLVQGICNGVRRAHPNLVWHYLSGEEFTNEFVGAIKTGRIEAFRAHYRQVDLLVVDDVHFLAHKKGTQEEFLHTFNAIDTCGRTVVLSSDRHPTEIATLSEPLINRLISGMVVQIEQPDFATRREILRRRALDMGAQLSDEVLDFVAHRIERNLRELEGALYRLVALAALAKQPADCVLARKAMASCGDPAARRPEAVDIERTVALHFGLARDAIHSEARDRTISLARGLAMYLIRKHTQLSYPEIGRRLGNKNHSTVLMAVRRMEETLQRNGAVTWRTSAGPQKSPLQNVVDELERLLVRSSARSQ